MPNALLIIANPSTASFSHAMADAASAALVSRGCYTLHRHDLYGERFDPVARDGDAQHGRRLAEADLIGIFHPNWWGQPPAILKGWIDRVFRPGVAYEFPPGIGAEGVPVGLLRAKAALVFNTSDTPWEREISDFGNPLETLWKNCVFGLCGVAAFERRVYGPMASSTLVQRQRWLAEVRDLVMRYA